MEFGISSFIWYIKSEPPINILPQRRCPKRRVWRILARPCPTLIPNLSNPPPFCLRDVIKSSVGSSNVAQVSWYYCWLLVVFLSTTEVVGTCCFFPQLFLCITTSTPFTPDDATSSALVLVLFLPAADNASAGCCTHSPGIAAATWLNMCLPRNHLLLQNAVAVPLFLVASLAYTAGASVAQWWRPFVVVKMGKKYRVQSCLHQPKAYSPQQQQQQRKEKKNIQIIDVFANVLTNHLLMPELHRGTFKHRRHPRKARRDQSCEWLPRAYMWI